MMIKKIYNHFIIYFFIIFIFFTNIKSDLNPDECQTCIGDQNDHSGCTKENCLTCGEKYKYFYSDDNNHKCVECSDLSDINNQYAKLETSEVDGNINCIAVTSKGDNQLLLILENKEVISGSSCPNNFYKLGDICYSDSSQFTTDIYTYNEGNREYNCNSYYYETANEIGFTIKTCLQNIGGCNNGWAPPRPS